MKIIDITNVEDIVLAKIDFDNYLISTGQIKEKMDIQEFMNTYAKLNKVYIDHGNIKPFALYTLGDESYLFVTDNDTKINEKIANILERNNYDPTNLTQIDISKIGETFENYDQIEAFIIDNQYYII